MPLDYFPFGVSRNSTGNLPTDKLFTCQRLDTTGLYYYNARYYDPQIGRFISPDTIVPNPTNPQSLNRYSYCLNNPLKYIDPSGLFEESELNGIGIHEDDVSDEWWSILREAKVGDATVINGQLYYFYHQATDYDENGRLSLLTEGGQFYDLSGVFAAARFNEFINKNQGAFDAWGKFNSAPNTLLGNILGKMGGGIPSEGPGGTMIYQNIDPDSPTGKLMSALNGNPITFGYVIITKDPQMKTDILEHELRHVTQYGILGPLFIPLYIADSIRAGGDWNNKLMEGPFLPNWPRRTP
jgi:RHS repeat-associated protein